MAYRVEIGSRADAQLAELDPAIGASVERKIIWLAENAAVMVESPARGNARGLGRIICKLRVGDWRILYSIYHREEIVRIYRIQHRSEVYRGL